jgi:hypothetical protein
MRRTLLALACVLVATAVATADWRGTVVGADQQPFKGVTMQLQPQIEPRIEEAATRALRQDSGFHPLVTWTDDRGSYRAPDPRFKDIPVLGWLLSGGYQDARTPRHTVQFDPQTGYRPVDTVGASGFFGRLPCVRRHWCLTNGIDCIEDKYITALPQHGQPAASGTSADMPSQWAFKKLGLPAAPGGPLTPVVVAVIDSGLDYAHPYLKPENIWKNPAPGRHRDYPDDRIGWNFVARTNNPWDDYGHGTFVSGIIVAVNPAARIMPLKVLDNFGGSHASTMTDAVVYAVENGARVINLSVGSKGLTKIEQDAVRYARSRGVVVVAAAGNDGVDTADFGPVGARGAIGVSATDANDTKPPFGNWGQEVALAAPGVDIVSLRARWTDFVLVGSGGQNYTPGANFVGQDRWFYRATGTSFAAPFVAGAASLLLSRDPNLTVAQVERMLVESADDAGPAGWDQFTGSGRLNIAAALKADPNHYLIAKVSEVAPAQEGGKTVIKVFGTAAGNRLDRYELQLGQGETPARWKTIATQKGKSVDGALLGTIPVSEITARGKWTVRVVARDTAARTREARGALTVQ